MALATLCLSAPPAHASPHQALPGDVLRFIERRDRCEHFGGEESYDDARRREIEVAVARHCRGTDKVLLLLHQRHHGRRDVLQAPSPYDNRIE